MLEEQVPLMRDMNSYSRKWREWRNLDLGNKSLTSIKEVEKDERMTANQPINQQINQSITPAQCQCQSIANRSFSTSFHHIQAFQQTFSNFITLFPDFSQVSENFLIIHS